jgi:hypothetical protein
MLSQALLAARAYAEAEAVNEQVIALKQATGEDTSSACAVTGNIRLTRGDRAGALEAWRASLAAAEAQLADAGSAERGQAQACAVASPPRQRAPAGRKRRGA